MFTKILAFLTLISVTAQAAYFPTVTVNNFDALGIYNLALPVLTDGGMSQLQLDVNGRLRTDANFQTLGVYNLVLPVLTDGGMSQLQLDVNSKLLTHDNHDADWTALLASAASIDGKIPANLTVTATRLLVDGSGVTQPVSAASLPLPTGAATETTLASIDTKVPANLTVTATRLLVDGSGVTQPVSAASLPLPTGAATEAKQDTAITALGTINTTLGSPFQAGASIGNTTFAATQATAANLKTSSDLHDGSGAAVNLGQSNMAGSLPVTIASNQSTLPISAASLPLPTNAATDTLQTSGNASLTSIDGKLANNFGAAAGALRTASQVGNATGAADFGAGNSSAQTQRVVIATDQAALPVTNTFSNPSIGTNGSAVPASSTQVAGTDGTNLRALSVNSSGVLALPQGAATSALQSATQGSVAAGTAATASTLAGGVYNTSAPTLTNGQQAALQFDVNGNLKTSSTGGGTSTPIYRFSKMYTYGNTGATFTIPAGVTEVTLIGAAGASGGAGGGGGGSGGTGESAGLNGASGTAGTSTSFLNGGAGYTFTGVASTKVGTGGAIQTKGLRAFNSSTSLSFSGDGYSTIVNNHVGNGGDGGAANAFGKEGGGGATGLPAIGQKVRVAVTAGNTYTVTIGLGGNGGAGGNGGTTCGNGAGGAGGTGYTNEQIGELKFAQISSTSEGAWNGSTGTAGANCPSLNGGAGGGGGGRGADGFLMVQYDATAL